MQQNITKLLIANVINQSVNKSIYHWFIDGSW